MERLMINGVEIPPPEAGSLQYDFETTYTGDSTRVMSGQDHFTPLFTVEQIGYTVEKISNEDAQKILRMVIRGGKFDLHYFSLYYNAWRTAKFRVAKGNIKIGKVIPGGYVESLSINMTGVDPI